MLRVTSETGRRGTGKGILTNEGAGREMRKPCSRLERDGYLCWRAVCEETRTHGSEGGGRKRTGRDTTRTGFWQVEAAHSTSPAPYPTKEDLPKKVVESR